MREDLLLDARDEDDRELEALRRVQGHEGDLLCVVIHPVHVGDQGDVLEEAAQPALWIIRVVLLREDLELSDVRLALFLAAIVRLGEPAPHVELRQERSERLCRRSLPVRRQVFVEGADLCQALLGAATDRVQRLSALRRLEDGNAPVRRPAQDLLHALRPHSARRDVRDACEGDLIVRVHQELQVGDQVTDLLALKELDPAQDLVRDPLAGEGGLQRPLHEVEAVEDGDLRGAPTAREERLDAVTDLCRLIVLVPTQEHPHRLAVRLVCEELLRLPRAVVRDHGLSGAQDVPGRAVVAL